MLTGHEILKQVKRNNIIIEPFNLDQLNPNSYNVRLGERLKVYERDNVLDLDIYLSKESLPYHQVSQSILVR